MHLVLVRGYGLILAISFATKDPIVLNQAVIMKTLILRPERSTKSATIFFLWRHLSSPALNLLSMLNNHVHFLRIRPINLDTPELRLDLPDSLLLFVRRCIPKYKIHILQCLASRFRNKEIREPPGQKTEGSEENVRSPFNLGEHIWGNEADDEIAHPGCGGRN
jgi:hypothetical protein